MGCQGGCERERRIEVIVKNKKRKWGKGENQVRVDVNEELKFLYLKKLGGGGNVKFL